MHPSFFALSAAVSTLHPLLVLGILYRISVFVLPTVLPPPIVVGILLLSATLVVIFCPPKGWWWLLMMCMLLSLILELEVIWMDLSSPFSTLSMIAIYPTTHLLLHIFLSAVPGVDLTDFGVFTRMSAICWTFCYGVATGLATVCRNCCDEFLGAGDNTRSSFLILGTLDCNVLHTSYSPVCRFLQFSNAISYSAPVCRFSLFSHFL